MALFYPNPTQKYVSKRVIHQQNSPLYKDLNRGRTIYGRSSAFLLKIDENSIATVLTLRYSRGKQINQNHHELCITLTQIR